MCGFHPQTISPKELDTYHPLENGSPLEQDFRFSLPISLTLLSIFYTIINRM